MPDEVPQRRTLLKAVVGGAAAVGSIAAAARAGLLSDGSSGPRSAANGRPVLVLTADGSSVAELEVPLGDDLLPVAGRDVWRSPELPTTVHSLVGFVWRRGEPEPRLRIRSRRDGRWTAWRPAPVLHDLPDDEDEEWAGRAGTQPVWVGAADGIQVRLEQARPRGLTLVLLHPAKLQGDDQHTRSAGPLARAEGDTPLPARPQMSGRKEWGADESWRNGGPRYNATIEQVHVHHTANSNDYLDTDVPALLRGIYRYHTHSLGWSDIAYNFLVDRFGRTWVGRAGGAAKPVRGAHTLGFNATSAGIAVIGNYDTLTPSAEVLGAIVRLAAWKLALYGRDPEATAAVVSEGSDKFRRAQVAVLPVIDGHRDTNDTACPGQHLYDVLPTVRTETAKRMQAAQSDPSILVAQPFVLAGEPLLGQALTVTPGTFEPADAVVTYTWLRDGVPTGDDPTLTAHTLTADDLGHLIGVQVDLQHAGYTAASQTLAAPGLVQAQAVVVIRAWPRHGNIKVTAAVSVPGLPDPPAGEVVIKADHRGRKTRTLVGGSVSVHLKDFGPGDHTIKARYLGTDLVLGAVVQQTVSVRH